MARGQLSRTGRRCRRQRTRSGQVPRVAMDEGTREHWNRRWAEGHHGDGAPPDWLEEVEAVRLWRGRALDIASGSGRVALWLARRGLRVTATDIAAVALSRCRERAWAEQLAVETLEIDLEAKPPPPGPWDMITCFHYLQREIFPALRGALAVGGLLVAEIATRRNLERHERPPARFLLEAGELRDLLAPLEVVHYREGWFDTFHVARGVARRPPLEA